MLMIRFQRTGRVNDPSFRIVVTEKTASPKAGKNVALVGSYDPKTKKIVIDAEAVKGWLGKGAKASGTVHNLLITQGIIEGKKMNVLGKKTPIIKKGETADSLPAAQDTAQAGGQVKETATEAEPIEPKSAKADSAEPKPDEPHEASPSPAPKESETPAP